MASYLFNKTELNSVMDHMAAMDIVVAQLTLQVDLETYLMHTDKDVPVDQLDHLGMTAL